MEKEEDKGVLGCCKWKERAIKIVDDLDEINTEITIRHEVTHAILYTQGRAFQENFTQEDVCEFIAWKLPEINDVVERIMNSRYAHS